MDKSAPTYKIFRDKHGIPQFEPRRNSKELIDALTYSFPSLSTELELMQAALRKFFDTERGSKFVCELPENDLQASIAKKKEDEEAHSPNGKSVLRNWKLDLGQQRPRPVHASRASSRASSRMSSRPESPASFLETEVVSGGTMTTWMLSNGQDLDRRRRQPYDSVKRRKVAENRGNACEKHRASKTAVRYWWSQSNVMFIY
jgi:hypothetical protein